MSRWYDRNTAGIHTWTQSAFYLGGCACHIYLELEYNSLDPQKAEFAWNRVINRHPMLRAVMSTDGSQRISEHVPEYKIRVVDCGANAAAERANIKSSLDHLVYDTEKWPLFTLLISRGDSKDILHISIEFVTRRLVKHMDRVVRVREVLF